MAYTTFNCSVCTRDEFVNQKAREDHINSPGHIVIYRCDAFNCVKYLGDRKLLFDHIRSHSGGLVFRFNESDSELSDDPETLNPFINTPKQITTTPKPHPKIHFTGPPAHIKFRCEQCDKCFIDQHALDQHSTTTHILHPRCQKCDKEFIDQYALDQHVVSPAHKLKFYCHECDRGFPTYGVLKQHHASAHTKQFRDHCKRCMKEFNTQRALDTHLRYSGHWIVVNCSVCDEKFGSREDFEIHMLQHPFLRQISVKGKKGTRTIETNDVDIWNDLKRMRDEHARFNNCKPVNLGVWARDRVGDPKRDSFNLVRPEKKKGEEGYIWNVIEG